MHQRGPLLASGRDADIFEAGPRTVIRRSRADRPLRAEADTMAHLHASGYPVPEVVEVSADGLRLEMERIDGPTMVEAIGAAPWTVRRHAHSLAELHLRLHELEAPATLEAGPLGDGDRFLHMDLHPLNVLVAPRGPVVIDWARACRGDPSVDVCTAWALIGAGTIPGNRVRAALLGVGRRQLVSAFLSHFDAATLAETIGDVVEWKARDPHLSPQEVAAMRRIAAKAAPG